MIRYGYSQQKIDELSLIDCSSTNWYNYKNLNFLIKFKNNNNNLVIFFHGAVPDIDDRECCFRGFNYDIENTDIICVSDILIGIYKNFEISWYLSSNKHNINNIYIEVFDYLINKKNYNKIIFTGTSGGGYPSLYFASYYNKIALISNSQIYPENYWHYKYLIQKLKENDDFLLYQNNDIEKLIMKQQPEKIYLYQNLNDDGLNYISNAYYSPFVKFINDNNLENILTLQLFNGNEPPEGKTHHHVFFPNNESYISILKQISKIE
jgi:predicted esterase YcpF (UPF0227 family)